MKKILRMTGFILVAVFCLLAVYHVLSWKDTIGSYLSTPEQLQATPRESVDLALLGSSHLYYGVNNAQLWRDQGIAAFSFTVSGMDQAEAKLYLKELYKTQSPKVVCIDLFSLLIGKQPSLANVYRAFLSTPLSSELAEAVRSVDPENADFFFTRWPIIHTRYQELTAFDFTPYAPGRFGRGYVYSFEQMAITPTTEEFAVQGSAMLDESQREWLDSMLAICQEHSSEVFFLMCPANLQEGQQSLVNAAAAYLRQQGVDCLDMNNKTEELALNYQTDFNDPNHLNSYGAQKLTFYLESYLAAHYEFPDRRGNDQYTLWEENEVYDRHQWNLQLLQEANSTDAAACAAAASNCPGVAVIVTMREETPTASAVLQTLGISSPAAQQGQWVLQGGQVTKELLQGSASLDLDAIHTLTLNRTGEKEVELNGTVCTDDGAALSLFVYDLYDAKIVWTGTW